MLIITKEELSLREERLDKDHLSTLNTMRNLAFALSGLSQHDEAMQIREKLLAASNQLFDHDNPSLLLARYKPW